ncbi:MAG: CopG family ribbon-helix-helix protein [Promethearchaeota archaeon]
MPIISLQITEDLLERFEKVRTSMGFSSKSDALRDAIANFIETHENLDNLKGYKIMAIHLVYPFRESLINMIAELFLKYRHVIKTTTDWRIADRKIELILTVGEAGIIKDFYQEIKSLKEMISSMYEIIID